MSGDSTSSRPRTMTTLGSCSEVCFHLERKCAHVSVNCRLVWEERLPGWCRVWLDRADHEHTGKLTHCILGSYFQGWQGQECSPGWVAESWSNLAANLIGVWNVTIILWPFAGPEPRCHLPQRQGAAPDRQGRRERNSGLERVQAERHRHPRRHWAADRQQQAPQRAGSQVSEMRCL